MERSPSNDPHEFAVLGEVVKILDQLHKEGGETSERQWTDILGVLNIQADALDRTYLENSANQLELDGLLKRALNEARA